jgi:hypothetical protein
VTSIDDFDIFQPLLEEEPFFNRAILLCFYDLPGGTVIANSSESHTEWLDFTFQQMAHEEESHTDRR